MITNEIKDRILFDLTSQDKTSLDFSAIEMSQRLNIPFDIIVTVINHFIKIGFVRLPSWSKPSGGKIEVQVEAYDFANHGGYLVQEELLKANIQKLGLEIDVLEQELSPKGLESAEKIASISSAILSALSFFK